MNEKDIIKIINSKINELKIKYKKYDINIDNKVIDEIKELSCYDEYGARKIDKIIKDNLMDQIIDNIISNNKTINIKSLYKIKT